MPHYHFEQSGESMNNEPNILKFPNKQNNHGKPSYDWDDDNDDFESWEAHYQLHENKDYPGLVRYCENEIKRHPEDIYAQIRLGEAYLLNNQYQDAVDSMGKCHRENPEIHSFSHLILEALFALGKTEDDFDWIQRPRILTIGPAVLDTCYEYLKPKRKPREVWELKSKLDSKVYLKFSDEDLLKAFIDDNRFVVEQPESRRRSLVRVRRKHES